MKTQRWSWTLIPVLLTTLALGGSLIPAHAASVRIAHTGASSRCVNIQGGGQGGTGAVWTRNFNPFLSGSSLVYNTSGIYEPLYVITTAGGGHTYPWLATSYKWMDGNKTLLLTIRPGVKWSDGVPFTAKDVAFTFNYGKKYSIADQGGLWTNHILKSVTLDGPNHVAVHFTKADTTVLPFVVDTIKIIPEHIWAKIKNPATFSNPNPVGTGPFTQVTFSSQVYTLAKNPYYWQKGKPAVACLRFPFETTVNALFHNEIDWSQDFVADIQKTYVAKDPQHNHYFFATDTPPVSLILNDAKYPFSLVGFRKAISYALDRTKLWKIGEYGYEPPSDAIGISKAWPTWVDKSLMSEATSLTTYNPDKAKSLLTRLGFTTKGGQLYDPKGHQVTIDLGVPSDWPDFNVDCEIIQQELRSLGIEVTIKRLTDANWFDQASKGLLDADLNFPTTGVTPYYYFNSFMSKESYVPTGQSATVHGGANYERWWSPEATRLLAQFRQTTDVATQHSIVNKLQKIQLDDLPIIPLMHSALWYTYRTQYFTGWPTPSNYYAIGGPGISYPDDVVVETRLVPAGS